MFVRSYVRLYIRFGPYNRASVCSSLNYLACWDSSVLRSTGQILRFPLLISRYVDILLFSQFPKFFKIPSQRYGNSRTLSRLVKFNVVSFIFQSKSVIFSEIEIIIRTYIRGRFKEKADSEKSLTDSIIFVCQKYIL